MGYLGGMGFLQIFGHFLLHSLDPLRKCFTAHFNHHLNFEPHLCARNSVPVSHIIQHKSNCANSRTIRCDDILLHELKDRFKQFNLSDAQKEITEGTTGTAYGVTASQVSFSVWQGKTPIDVAWWGAPTTLQSPLPAHCSRSTMAQRRSGFRPTYQMLPVQSQRNPFKLGAPFNPTVAAFVRWNFLFPPAN
ncbi:hypothetical protein XMV201_002412 [Aliiroseovarius sp. xm-v-201]|nr:hypothetical protein [Aliiroseovarius sp. xm-m-354]NRQ05394.1 hypothetical protein [Aliiroseovarius sp. xm-m-309]NRQ08599.1 hypothetical protein [Aliiroseovarius sp. xm-v-201]